MIVTRRLAGSALKARSISCRTMRRTSSSDTPARFGTAASSASSASATGRPPIVVINRPVHLQRPGRPKAYWFSRDLPAPAFLIGLQSGADGIGRAGGSRGGRPAWLGRDGCGRGLEECQVRQGATALEDDAGVFDPARRSEERRVGKEGKERREQ